MTNPNDPAFIDAIGTDFKNGLTKREYFSAMAMSQINSREYMEGSLYARAAAHCLKMADALIHELNKSEK